jgi:putative ABC transport system permease protein
VRNLFSRQRVERELDDELQACLDLLIEENLGKGLAADEARRRALIELQGIEQVKERIRSGRAGAAIEQVWQDLSYGLRILTKHRGFTATAVATLALGIGINTAVFTIVDTVVFRSLPYDDPLRLVKICGNAQARPIDDVSLPDFVDIGNQSTVFSSMAADNGSGFTVEYGGIRQQVNGGLITPEWLPTLGVRALVGRGFLPEEGQPGRDRVVVLTYEYWRRRFESDANIVGKIVSVDGEPFTIVGVLPPNVLRSGADILKPLVLTSEPDDRAHRDLDVFARLRPGVTIVQARAEIEAIGRRLQQEHPETNRDRGFSVIPLDKYYAAVESNASRGLLLMFGAVALVLLIACVNVVNLLLAKTVTRSRECVVRAALGASRGRLVRQLLVENLLLFVAGGALGMLLARWLVDSLVELAMVEGYVPNRLAVVVDSRVLAFCLSISLLTGVVFGLAVALRASRVNPSDGLRVSTHTMTGGLRRSRARRALIVAELALSLILLVGFTLVTRSFLDIQSRPLGFVAENVLETGSDGGRVFDPAVTFWRSALERARAIPGVQFAAVASRPPIHAGRTKEFAIEGSPTATGVGARGGDILVSSDYFRMLSIPVLKGRVFTDRDTDAAPPVVVISQALARRYFPDSDPIGRRISLSERGVLSCCAVPGPVEGVWREIVGVVGDIRQGNLDEEPAATLYRPFTQIVEHDMFLMVRARSSAEAAQIAVNLRSNLAAANPGSDWWDVRSMKQVMAESESLRLRRFVLILLGSFAGLALVLAAVGLYGVVAYSVAERRQEIGIRVALGATRSIILKEVLGESMRLSLVSLAIGSVLAFLMARLISSMLFGISSTDALTYVVVAMVLTAVTLAATYVPARRAARVDPISALREP